MPNYKELMKEYQYNPGEESTTGVRVFVQQATGPITTLPAIGDVLPSNPALSTDYPVPANCLLRTISIIAFNSGTGQGDSQYKYVFNYSTKANNTSIPDPEDEPENLTMGGEFMQLPNLPNSLGSLYESGGDPMREPDYMLVSTAQYDKTEIYTTMQGAIDDVKNQIGRVMAAGNGNAANEAWLALGASISQFIDNDGDDAFKAVRQYSYKFIPHADGDAGWNHVWNPMVGKFTVKRSPTGAKRYESAVFTDTLPTLGVITP